MTPLVTAPELAPIEGCVARLIRGERLSSDDREAAQEAFSKYDSNWVATRDGASDVTRAQYYLVACKMGFIDRSRHGGWPFRYAYMRSALSGIRELLETSDDPYLLACAVTAAVHEGEFEFAKAQLKKLERSHEHWTTYAYDVLQLAVDMKPQYQKFLDELDKERGDDLPVTQTPIDLDVRFLGSHLVKKNLFRLAELPVGRPHRDAQQRLTITQTAADVGAPIPRGRSPLFTVRSVTLPADLRTAVDQTRDPLHRLVHEVFWFWNGEYTGESDDGLQYLLEDKRDLAEDCWARHTTTLVAMHNLALSQTLHALENDGSDVLWTQALTGWMLTLRDPRFHGVLARHVADIADPRLPPSMIPGICAQLPIIAISIAVDTLVRAAKEGRLETVDRLKAALAARVEESTIVRTATDVLTKDLQERVRFLATSLDRDCTADVLRTPALSSTFVEQVHPLLDLLARIYPAGDDFIVDMYDSVARRLLIEEVAFGAKTDDWAVSTTLAEQAMAFARGEAMRAKLSKELEIVKGNLDADNTWVAPGYFELSAALIAQLEAARSQAEARNHERAIDMLRTIFLARHDHPSPDALAAVVRHCAAYTIRSLSSRIWNEAAAVRRKQWKVIADSALKRSKSAGICTMCGARIDGKYFVRTFSDTEYDFCIPCDSKLDKQYAAVRADFAREANRSHHLDLLAQHFNPHNRHLKEQMAVTDGVQFVPQSPWKLLLEWNFVDVASVIDELVTRSIPDEEPAMVAWLVEQLSKLDPAAQEPLMRRLFEQLAATDQNADEGRLRAVLNEIATFGSTAAMSTALSLTRAGVIAGLNRSRFLALALFDDDPAIRTVARQELEQAATLRLRPILEACHTPQSPAATAVELLSSCDPTSFEDVPTVAEFIAHALTLLDPDLVDRCFALMRIRHPGWTRDGRKTEWLPWLKWSAASGPPPHRKAARALLQEYRETGVPARVTLLWAGKSQPQRPGDAWWETSALPEGKNGGANAR